MRGIQPERPTPGIGRVGGRNDPGVPVALPMAGRVLAQRVDSSRIDRLWVFPPTLRGRRESGLLVASLLIPNEADRRVLVTLRYTAEETGKGVVFEPALQEEGTAPPDRLPRIIAGVVRRSGMEGGDPREIPVEGHPETFEQWLADLDAAAREEATP